MARDEMREYDEEREFIRYVLSNYRWIARRYELLPSDEVVRDALPSELRDEYWKNVVECRQIMKDLREKEERESREGRMMQINPILPRLPPKVLQASSEISDKLQKQAFWAKFQPHKDAVSINRCPKCARILVNEHSRQCLWCGHDWH